MIDKWSSGSLIVVVNNMLKRRWSPFWMGLTQKYSIHFKIIAVADWSDDAYHSYIANQ